MVKRASAAHLQLAPVGGDGQYEAATRLLEVAALVAHHLCQQLLLETLGHGNNNGWWRGGGAASVSAAIARAGVGKVWLPGCCRKRLNSGCELKSGTCAVTVKLIRVTLMHTSGK